MAYGLAEGLKKTRIRIGRRGGAGRSIVATFGNHFIMNEALEEFRKLGLSYDVRKDHIVTIQLGKSTSEIAEKVRKIIRDHYGYVEP
jgi:hypothetical protein